MNWTVDTPIQAGDAVIAAIVEFKVTLEAAGASLTGFAEKQPILVLQIRKGSVTGIDIKGHRYQQDEIELLFPDAIAQICAHQKVRQ